MIYVLEKLLPSAKLQITVLSRKSITGRYAGMVGGCAFNSIGGYSAPEATEFKVKTGWVSNDYLWNRLTDFDALTSE